MYERLDMSLTKNNLFPDEKLKKPSDSRRDVMVHVAVTIMDRRGQIKVIGEKENEICQFAAELDYKWVPLNAKQAKSMFEKLSRAAFDKMVAHGLIRF